ARALAGLEPADAVPRRVPVPVLRPPLGVCKPTPVTLGPAGRVVVMPDRGGVAAHLVRLLRDRGVTPLVVDDDPAPAALRGRLEEWAGDGAIQGVYWLPALDAEPSIEAMTPADWKLHVRRRVKLLYATMRSLYESVAEPESFLVAATRLGGMHGYDDAGAVAPMGGAVTGFVKAYKRERIEPLVKAVDVEANADPARVAELIVDETMRDPDAVEVGYRSGLRWSVALRERSADDGNPGLPLTPDTVFVVTGAAGGIVSAIVADLAAASGGTFHLLDLAPEPDPDDPDIARFVADRDGLKRDLFERIRARGERATPVMAERELRAVERKQAALAAIEAVRSSGGTATYHELDLTDAGQVGAAIDAIRRRHGRIDVLVHAAGMEISHALPDKESREFDLVFDVKADGWCNLMRAAHDVPLGAAVAFTSVAGRFGNAGQTDYAAANDLLCKHVSSLRTTRPGTRGIAIDWTAWAGIGMATRGSIPQAMAAAGIDMMPPETGIPVVRRELVSGGTRGEVVIAGSLGTLTEDFDETGGLDPELAGALVAPVGEVGPMVGRVSAMTAHDGQTVETVLDPRVQPFLFDHVMDGTALLPGVMGAEAFAEVAALALPGWRVAAIEDMRYDAAFKFYRNEPRKLVLRAAFRPEGDEIVAECRLIGERTLPVRPDPLSTTHFTGSVRLSRAASEPLRIDRVALPAEGFVEAGDIYRVYFHGPSYQVLERAWPSAPGGVALGLFRVDLPPDSAPADAPLVAAPRLIEFCYQTIGSWEIAELGRFGLPRSFERVTLFEHPEGRRTPLVAVVTPRNGGEAFDATVVDADGGVVLRLDGYRSVELPGALDPDQVQIFRGAARSPA
ncbi:MAG TPA: SDR family oxidoreductase, partial [Actinomycetota bacterium]|nr:SDR family oxidoreductase [Actinomycetota bacterium]